MTTKIHCSLCFCGPAEHARNVGVVQLLGDVVLVHGGRLVLDVAHDLGGEARSA